MTTANSRYTFVALYKSDATEFTVHADTPHDACIQAFTEAVASLRPGWRSLIPCDSLSMRNLETLTVGDLVQAARDRVFVRLVDGTLARLIYWQPPRRGRKVRVEIRPGVHYTVKPERVAAVATISSTARENNQ